MEKPTLFWSFEWFKLYKTGISETPFIISTGEVDILQNYGFTVKLYTQAKPKSSSFNSGNVSKLFLLKTEKISRI